MARGCRLLRDVGKGEGEEGSKENEEDGIGQHIVVARDSRLRKALTGTYFFWYWFIEWLDSIGRLPYVSSLDRYSTH